MRMNEKMGVAASNGNVVNGGPYSILPNLSYILQFFM